ncbi:hypothetical protein CHELA20_53548 [Hyphomicrobiales bacterium]|nr:hypothetical protein CHELA41_21380 [Hyphomicrobiales bacterium]CAH1684470.1 hypothetical protein CHELA20_53548 [Hyphomicrobiales bacterium]
MSSGSIDMSEVTPRLELVADALFQRLHIRKAIVPLSLPDDNVIAVDLENAAGARDERDLADIGTESRQKLLRHPARPQQPLALGAIGDDDARLDRIRHGV